VEAKRIALQETVDRFKDDMQSLTQNLDATQGRLAKRHLEVETRYWRRSTQKRLALRRLWKTKKPTPQGRPAKHLIAKLTNG
jgi:hypothetical protein